MSVRQKQKSDIYSGNLSIQNIDKYKGVTRVFKVKNVLSKQDKPVGLNFFH